MESKIIYWGPGIGDAEINLTSEIVAEHRFSSESSILDANAGDTRKPVDQWEQFQHCIEEKVGQPILVLPHCTIVLDHKDTNHILEDCFVS